MQTDLWKRSDAVFSSCETYRYVLSRSWAMTLPDVCFIMLNPSTADHAVDDPTIRRCLDFARQWGYGSLQVVNLFALRATDPQALRQVTDPVGPANDQAIVEAARTADRVVVAWGVHGSWRQRDATVCRLLEGTPLYHLGLTKDGQPKHPLYLRRATKPQRYLR